jgi:multidrug efflux system outer membrane protein
VTSPTFRDAPEQQESIADLPWWEVFKDETLQGLVREALEQNRDLATAISNMERSRDIAAVQRGQLFPQVGYTGIASRGKQASLGNIDTNNSTTSSVYAGVLNAAWELDIWGRIRRATEPRRPTRWPATRCAAGGVVAVT